MNVKPSTAILFCSSKFYDSNALGWDFFYKFAIAKWRNWCRYVERTISRFESCLSN